MAVYKIFPEKDATLYTEFIIIHLKLQMVQVGIF